MSIKYERDTDEFWGPDSMRRLVTERNGTDWRMVCIIGSTIVWERAKDEPPAQSADVASRGWIVCSRCEGDGRVLLPDDSKAHCYECDGRGKVRLDKGSSP